MIPIEKVVHPTKRLGKQEFTKKDKDFMLADFMTDQPKNPPHYDPYARWKKVPSYMWGNNAYGDCVIAARANLMLRLEKYEHGKLLPMQDDMAVEEYKRLTGCQYPGDSHDVGLVIRDALDEWRTLGWQLHLTTKKPKNYAIDSYMQVDLRNRDHIQTSIHVLHGLQVGLALPLDAQHMHDWDVTSGPGSDPGSWGGHCVDAYGYNEDGLLVWTWKEQIHVTWAFLDKYADESWAVVDVNESHSRWINVQHLEEVLHSVGE